MSKSEVKKDLGRVLTTISDKLILIYLSLSNFSFRVDFINN
jgi:hypothetical protein